MGRGTNPTETAVLQVLDLRHVREGLPEGDPERREEIDGVIEDLEAQVGRTLAKASAARILGVSTQALDKWIDKGLLPVVRKNGRRRIPLDPLLELASVVRDLRKLGKNRAVLAEALRRLANEENSDYAQALQENLGKSLEAVRKGRLKKLTLPEDWHPED